MKMQTGNFAKQPKKAQNGGKKAYGCNQCNYASDWPNKLKCHMLVHSGEKPFSCIQCNNSAARAFDLKSHMLIHSGEKPFTVSTVHNVVTPAHEVTNSNSTSRPIQVKSHSIVINAIIRALKVLISKPTSALTTERSH